ncbi:aminodeoxychorismate lyase [Aquitalea sp. S1-19]|nr:aminodeoxychorismate lyase [Aquitalea sp. S1-19]MCP9759860.1 aminodeoxychorismate lyase [Aquitalea sp. S1-19]
MMVLVNGELADTLSVHDRALAYGDGVYRTLELIDGQPRLWPWQWARLQADCAALALPCPDETELLAELARAAAGLVRAVAKVTISRGQGMRGYAIPVTATGSRVVAVSAWSGYPPACAREGIAVRWCDMRLAIQPRLAGIKHLNRLENVLARSEWQDPALREGLMLDSEGYVVEGTMSNLFVLRGGEVLTPALDRCGVSGALRAWLLDSLPALGYLPKVVRLLPQDVLMADEVFLCNSLIGIWPLARLNERFWDDFALAQRLQARLAREP